MQQANAGLIKQAKMVLDYNWTGMYTRPGLRLYPHQWSWGLAFVAFVYTHYPGSPPDASRLRP